MAIICTNNSASYNVQQNITLKIVSALHVHLYAKTAPKTSAPPVNLEASCSNNIVTVPAHHRLLTLIEAIAETVSKTTVSYATSTMSVLCA